MTSKTPKYVELKWLDAWSSNYRTYAPNEFKTERGLLVTSIGHLVANTKHGVTLAISYMPSEDSSHRNVLFVPRGMVKSLRTLK